MNLATSFCTVGAPVGHVVSAEELQQFGTDGHLVVRGAMTEQFLAGPVAEVEALVAGRLEAGFLGTHRGMVV